MDSWIKIDVWFLTTFWMQLEASEKFISNSSAKKLPLVADLDS